MALAWGESLSPISPCSGAPRVPLASPINTSVAGGSIRGPNFLLGSRGKGTQNHCFASLLISRANLIL